MLVTGGTKESGRAIAEGFAAEGARVAICTGRYAPCQPGGRFHYGNKPRRQRRTDPRRPVLTTLERPNLSPGHRHASVVSGRACRRAAAAVDQDVA